MNETLLTGHRVRILRYLREHGPVNKSELSEVITSPPILSRELDWMQEAGLLTITESRIGRRTFKVELTPKGDDVAYQVELAIEASVMTPPLNRKEIQAKHAETWKSNFDRATKNLSALYHVNVLDDHVTIGEKTATGERVINIYVKVNGHGILRLWCEEDESFECIHVQYAWTLPDVQEMYFNQVNAGNVRK